MSYLFNSFNLRSVCKDKISLKLSNFLKHIVYDNLIFVIVFIIYYIFKEKKEEESYDVINFSFYAIEVTRYWQKVSHFYIYYALSSVNIFL